MRLGFFIVEQLDGEDAQGAAFMAKVKSQMNEAIKGTLFLPPYLRPNQCNIAADSVLFGCLDEVTGRGFAIFGQEDADYQYFMDASLQIKQNLSVVGNAAIGGDASVGGNESVSGDSQVSGNVTATGNVTGADCRVTLAGGTFMLPNPAWEDDGQQSDPDAHGEPRYKEQHIAGMVSSLANHTHTCAVGPTSTPVPVPLPG
ncbi:MAG: hypothetical protein IJ165_00230 [Proteobacteria bacterium]|nr:hypothetical protein [Pseudomonadota bacterium]